MAHPYRDGGASAKAKMKRMLGQKPGTNVGKFSDAPITEQEIGRHLQGYDIRMPGGAEKSKVRLDRRARGGRTKKAGTTVNVLVGGHGTPQPTPLPVLPGGGGGGPPVPPPRPPMAGPPMPPPGMGGPGGPPMLPPGMVPRKRGGKVIHSDEAADKKLIAKMIRKAGKGKK